jgi:polar amino acid transport system ATP-binding protein
LTARKHAGNGAKPVAVAVDDLHKSFGDLEVLKGVSLRACEGDVVSMIGASGSGKSTFLRCINFLEMPTRGRIEVTGEAMALKTGKDGNLHPTDRRQLERIRTRLGMVFQSFNLQHMTVLHVTEAWCMYLKTQGQLSTEKDSCTRYLR